MSGTPRPAWRTGPRLGWGAFALLLAAVVVLNAHPVPYGNEYFYLLAPYQWAHPDFLQRDWTFTNVFGIHLVFNAIVGTASRWIPLMVIGVVGRLICWVAVVWLLLELAERYGLSRGAAIVAIGTWSIVQSLYGYEWLFGGFEAKVVSYVLVLAGLLLVLSGRDLVGASLFGLAFTFHSSVGLSVLVGLAIGFLLAGTPPRRLVLVALVGAVAAAPGVISILPTLAGGTAEGNELWRHQVEVVMPHHLELSSFPNSALLVSFLMLAFNLAESWPLRGRRDVRVLAGFQLGVALVTLVGIAISLAGAYTLLKIFPFRVFPLLIPLFFLFHLFRAFLSSAGRSPPARLALLAFACLILFPNPLVALRTQGELLRSEWTAVRDPDDTARAFEWIAHNTPRDAIIIAPPWRRDSYFLSRRAQIANLSAVAFGRLKEWTARVESMVGPLDRFAGEDRTDMMQRYDSLTVSDLASIRARFGADYHVGRIGYELPTVFRTPTRAVYNLRGLVGQ